MFFLSSALAVVDSSDLAVYHVLRNPVKLANIQHLQFDQRPRLNGSEKNLVNCVDPNREVLVAGPSRAIYLKYDALEVGHSGDEQAQIPLKIVLCVYNKRVEFATTRPSRTECDPNVENTNALKDSS